MFDLVFNRSLIFFFIYYVSIILYAGLMESSSWRATVGKKLMGLYVLSTEGQRLTKNQSFIRNSIKYIPTIPSSGFIFIPILFTKGNLGIHDIFAKTKVSKIYIEEFEGPFYK